MIIDQPCVSCGITLEKGVKIVSVVDIIKGGLGVIIAAVLLVYYQPDPVVIKSKHKSKEGMSTDELCREEVTKEKIVVWYYDGFWISLIFLVVSCVEIFLAIILLYSAIKKNVPLLHFWLIITGFLTPVNMFLIKIYEMIVVFAFTEDLTCEAGGKALEEFRKLPYMCNIKTQLYPSPVFGPENISNMNSVPKKGSTIYLTDKSFLMNVDTSVFSMVHHQRY